tara:strand:+ start:1894 stop:2124 length:231 start_codon:yes stop_codon:yes gene_type:complete
MNYKYLKNFYQAYYPNDDMGDEIRFESTFEGLLENINKPYDYIGVFDSIVRERLFDHLATLKGVGYDSIYNLYFKK